MSALQQTLAPLINGVSQQADSQSGPGTVRECTDFLPDPVWGLAKRSGSELVRSMVDLGDGSWFNISPNETEDFVVFVGYSGDVVVLDSHSGVAQPVVTQVPTYAAHEKKGDIEVLQVGDFTFILNRTKTVAKSGDLTPSKLVHAWLELTSVSYNTEYRASVEVGSSTYNAVYVTPNSGNISTTSVLNGIRNAMIAALPATIETTLVGSVIAIRHSDINVAIPILVRATGGFVGDALKAFSGRVSDIAELPPQFLPNRPVFVQTSVAQGSGYWVTFDYSQDSLDVAGTWVETVREKEQYRFDSSTLPHVLIRTASNLWVVQAFTGLTPLPPTETVSGVPTSLDVALPSQYKGWYGVGQVLSLYGGTGRGLKATVSSIDDTYSSPLSVAITVPGSGYTAGDVVRTLNGDVFGVDAVTTQTVSNPITFAGQAWTARSVGDLSTIDWPSFVGKRITGISFFLNRLVFMSQDNVITSKAGDYLNFWPTSAVQVLPDDPVDLNAGANASLSFRYAVPYNRQLVLISEDTQYAFRSKEDSFSPASAELTPISRVKTSTTIAPIQNQQSWFVIEEGAAGVKLYNMMPGKDDNPNLADPELLNVQAPSYVPSFVFTGSADPDAGLLAVVSERDRKGIYLWRWTDVGRQRLQSAWFKWTSPQEIKHIYMLDDYLYVIGNLNGFEVLTRIRLGVTHSQGVIQFGTNNFDPRIDLQFHPTSLLYDEQSGVTTINVEGSQFSGTPGVFVVDGPKAGLYVTGTFNRDLNTLVIGEDLETTNIILGNDYTAKALLPHIYVGTKDAKDVINPPKVRRLKIRAFHTGAFNVTLKVPGRELFTKECTIRTPNNYFLDTTAMFRTVVSTVPCMCDGDRMDLTIQAPYPIPTNIQEITWSGTYTTRGIAPK